MRTFFAVLIFFYAAHANAGQLAGLVVRIIDGDAIVVLDAGKHQHKIRLTEIDAPEKAQPWGTKSKQALAGMIFHKDVLVKTAGTDRHGRTLGRIYLDGKDINRAMVAAGDAWVYRDYMTEPSFLKDEQHAREQKLGLWSMPNPIPPWEWRHGGHRTSRTSTNAAGKAFTCGTKQYCRQMTSCAEAEFYLHQCGLARLDGDHDGVPCESICR